MTLIETRDWLNKCEALIETRDWLSKCKGLKRVNKGLLGMTEISCLTCLYLGRRMLIQ